MGGGMDQGPPTKVTNLELNQPPVACKCTHTGEAEKTSSIQFNLF